MRCKIVIGGEQRADEDLEENVNSLPKGDA